MATRKQIRNQILTELETAVDGTTLDDGSTFSKSEVYFDAPENDVVYPRVTYEYFPRSISYNDGAKPAPKEYTTNASGEKDGEVYPDYWVIRFDVRVVGAELDKEPLVEAVHSQFNQFETWRSDKDLHADVQDIRVLTPNPGSDTDMENTSRFEIIPIEVEYYRRVTRDGTPIRAIETLVDADNDGTVDGETYTTT